MVTPISKDRKRRWDLTPDQEAFLRDNYTNLSLVEMSAVLHTSTWTVQMLLRRLNLKKTREQIMAIMQRRSGMGRNLFHVVTHRRNEERDELVQEAARLYHTLGFCELPLFWRMYKQGVKKSEMCRYWNIRETHCMECLEVCEMIWGRGPRKMAVTEPEPPTVGDAKNLREQPAATTPLVRPPAVYSNRSPYGIASPGM